MLVSSSTNHRSRNSFSSSLMLHCFVISPVCFIASGAKKILTFVLDLESSPNSYNKFYCYSRKSLIEMVMNKTNQQNKLFSYNKSSSSFPLSNVNSLFLFFFLSTSSSSSLFGLNKLFKRDRLVLLILMGCLLVCLRDKCGVKQ